MARESEVVSEEVSLPCPAAKVPVAVNLVVVAPPSLKFVELESRTLLVVEVI